MGVPEVKTIRYLDFFEVSLVAVPPHPSWRIISINGVEIPYDGDSGSADLHQP